MAAVEHAGPAVDDEVIGREILGEVIAPHKVKGKSSPIFFRRRFGILTRPMSSVVGAWAQASATKIFASSAGPARAAALPKDGDIALIPGKQDEKDVSWFSSGFAAQTVGKAWESVI